MRRGTNPVLTFELPEAITISALYITFQQNRQTVLEKDLTNVTYEQESGTDDTSTTKAATPSAVKAAYDLAAGKQSPATSLAGYGIADAYTKDEVDAKMSSALEYKGSKDTYADLPTTGNKKGDVWNIVNADAAHGVNAGDNVAWNGTTWDVLAGTVDLTAYMLASDLVAISNAELDNICK